MGGHCGAALQCWVIGFVIVAPQVLPVVWERLIELGGGDRRGDGDRQRGREADAEDRTRELPTSGAPGTALIPVVTVFPPRPVRGSPTACTRPWGFRCFHLFKTSRDKRWLGR